MRLGVLLVAVGVLGQGCLPIVLPPTRVRASTGPTLGQRADGRTSSFDNNVQLTGAIHPLQAIEQAQDQPFDVGVGWGLDSPMQDRAGALVHGPELELGYYPLRTRNGDSEVRLGGFTALELLFAQAHDGPPGYGATLGANVELTGFSEGTFKGDKVAGGHVGQWAIGVFAGVSRRVVGEASYGAAMVGISVRLPLIGAVICCAEPGGIELSSGAGDSSSSDDDNHRSNEGNSHRDERVERTPASPRAQPARTPANPKPRR